MFLSILEVLINTVNQNLQYLLPLDLELSNEGLKKGRFLEIVMWTPCQGH